MQSIHEGVSVGNFFAAIGADSVGDVLAENVGRALNDSCQSLHGRGYRAIFKSLILNGVSGAINVRKPQLTA